MHAFRPNRLALSKHGSLLSWDSQLATYMIRLFWHQYQPAHGTRSALLGTQSCTITAKIASRRTYYRGAGGTVDQDVLKNSRKSRTPSAQNPSLALLGSAEPEMPSNPITTIVGSSKGGNRRGESALQSLRKAMDDALKSCDTLRVWQIYRETTDRMLDIKRCPFSAGKYYQILQCFNRANTAESAVWARAVYKDMTKYHKPTIQVLNMVLNNMMGHEDVGSTIDFVHTEASAFNLSPNIRTLNIILRGLVLSGQTKAAQKMFEEMRAGSLPHRPDITTYSTIVSHYCNNGLFQEADKMLNDMLEDNIKPTIYIFNTVVKRFVKQKDYTAAQKVLALMNESGLKPDLVTYSILIDGYANDGDEEAIAKIQAEMALNKIYPNTSMITSMIKVFARVRLDSDIDGELEEILKGLPPGEMNDLTFGVLMNVYGKRKDLDAAMGIYRHIVSKGREVHEVIVGSLLDGYVRANEIQSAYKIFHDHFTARGIQPTTAWVYSILITGCCKQRDLKVALRHYDEMRSLNIEPEKTTCSRMIQLFLAYHQLENAQEMLRHMQTTKMEISVHTYTMLMEHMSSSRNLKGALRYYQEMLDEGIQPDVHCYTVLINAFIRVRNFAACDRTYEQMIKSGIEPTLEALTSMLHAYSLRSNIGKVKEYWETITDMGLFPDHISFTALMQTYSQQGNAEMVEFIFKDIIQRKIKIDTIMLITLINTYSDLPRLNTGRIDEIMGIMEDLELEPSSRYYALLLDTFGRHKMPDRVVKVWRQAQSLKKVLDWVPTTSNLLYLIESCRERGYIDVLHSVWRVATRGSSRSNQGATPFMESMGTGFSLEALPAPEVQFRPEPEVFSLYLNALLTHNRFNEIEKLLEEECREMRLTPRTEDFDLLFTGLAQYDFLKKELESIRRIVVERWPWAAPMVDKIILNTRKI